MSKQIRIFVSLLFLAINLFSQNKGDNLPVKNPVSAGFNSKFLSAFYKQLHDSIPSLGSFLVWRNDGLIYEKYFHGADSNTSFNIKSVTKSVVSALAGIAKGKGLLPDLNTPVIQLFPEFAEPHSKLSTVWFADEKLYQDSLRRKITLYHLLTMQHGWDWNDFSGPVFIFTNAADPIRFTFDIPIADNPGKKFIYCSPAASLFGAALEKSVHTNLKDFAEKNLFQPSGIHCTRWDTDPQGRTLGCSEMYLTARDMMRFGLLYLHKGSNGHAQIVPADWIAASLEPHAALNYWDVLPGANGYGYFWWRRKTHGKQAYVASGAGGQIITIVPNMDMVIVATCFLNEHNRGRTEIKTLHKFVGRLIANLK